LSWKFLLKTLEVRGFPSRWILWIEKLVLQGYFEVIVNSVAGKRIILKKSKARRSLSPYVFNLAIDFLARWIQKLNYLDVIRPIFLGCKSCLFTFVCR
jgi:hypothetical protein